MNGGQGQWNETTLCLLMNPANACNITMVGFEFGDTVQSITSAAYLHNDWPWIHHTGYTQINLGKMGKAHGLLYLNDTSKSSLRIYRGHQWDLPRTPPRSRSTPYATFPESASRRWDSALGSSFSLAATGGITVVFFSSAY
ncbi:hypothetical protein TNCV_2618811 [Trichonephila clavipes]|nr:hypothetical protein TNCV_2618811 [Trichonephila clavipes]